MKNFRKRIDVKRLSYKKVYLKCTSKPSYMSHKIFDSDLVAIRKNQSYIKRACIRICFLELSKVLMYEVHYDYIKIKTGNSSRQLSTDTDSLMSEVKTENFSNHTELFDFSSYSVESK